MKIVRFPSTKLKKDTAEIINLVAYGNIEAIIERHGEPLVRIVPVGNKKEHVDLEKKLKKHFGSIPDFQLAEID